MKIRQLLYQNKKLQLELVKEKQKFSMLKFNYDSIKSNEESLKFFTGLPTAKHFEWVYSMIDGKVKKIVRYLSFYDHLLLVLMKLKLGLYNKDLAFRFKIKPVAVSRIFRGWLPILAEYLQQLIVWPEKEALRKHLPKSFKKFQKCVSIIDCTEIFIERPLNLNARAQTWSNYKNHNTVKYLISITPAGAISFISKGWGGKVSDKEITINSGYLDKLENGDVVMADHGFTIDVELTTREAILDIPSFTRGKSQLPASDVDNSRKIATVRIHVERVIGRLKKFDILNKNIPISQVDLLDNILVITCALVNLNVSVVSA